MSEYIIWVVKWDSGPCMEAENINSICICVTMVFYIHIVFLFFLIYLLMFLILPLCQKCLTALRVFIMEIFFLFQLWQIALLRIIFWIGSFLSFRTWNTFQVFPDFIVSGEKSSNLILIVLPLYVIWHSSVAAFKSFPPFDLYT